MMAVVLPDLGVTLDEESHTYALPNGTHPPGVTDIMWPMNCYLYRGIPDRSMDIAAGRGLRVHKQTYWLDTCGYTDEDPDTVPHMDAYRQWISDLPFKPIWLAREWMSYHKSLLYAGTIDGIGYLTPPDDTGVDLWDLKTTMQFHGIMLKTQVAGGYKSIVESWGIKVRRCYGTCLLPGRTPPYMHQELKGEDGYRNFLACLMIHNAMANEIKP